MEKTLKITPPEGYEIDIEKSTLDNIVFKEIEIGLYSAISIFIMGKMLDILFEGIYFTKLAIIISDKSEEIAKRIEKNMKIMGFFWILEGIIGLAVLAYMMYKYFFS